ncbi:MAG: YggT family protein [Ilumatobacter sp.]|nr:YggT family protein [bacterium]MDG1267139.1 YggT family protein [Ilumatobacter sp.]MDG2039868.1 YggT family protein [Ilumatobacter sp.]
MSDTTTAGQYDSQPMEPEPHYMRSTGRIAAIVARFISYLAYVYIIFVEVILFLGFFLLLFGANPSSSFVEWAYRNLDRAMKPFRGIFTPIELGTTNGNQIESIFDTSVLFAMIIYGIIGLLIHSLIQWLTYKVRMIERQDRNEEAAIEAARIRHEMLRSGMTATTTVTQATPTGTTSTTATAVPPPSDRGSVPPPPSSPTI